MRAISIFNLEAGTSTFWCRARIALRIRASMSATGSLKFIVLLLLGHPFSPLSEEPAMARYQYCVPTRTGYPIPNFASLRNSGRELEPYQDDFATPGISPRKASPRKHKRHRPNLRKYPRGRPQSLQRLCRREENFGFFTFCGFTLLSVPSLTRFAVVANLAPSLQLLAQIPDHPMTRSRDRPIRHALNGIPKCFSNARA